MSAHDWPRVQALSLHVPALSLLVDLSKTNLAGDALRRGPLVTSAFPAAFAAMDALEAGAIANPDEKRMVGHYWLRAPERAPDPEIGRRDPRTLASDRGVRDRRARRPCRAGGRERFTHLLADRHRRFGARTAVRRGRSRLAARPSPAVLLRQHRSRRHGARALALAPTEAPARDAHGRDLEVRRHEGDAQRDARRAGRVRARGSRLREARGRRHGGPERARRGRREGRMAGAVSHVGLGRRADVRAVRGRPPSRRAPGIRHPGDARRRRRVRRGHARPGRREEPGRDARARMARGDGRPWREGHGRPAVQGPAAPLLAATSSSSSWSHSARRRTSRAAS